MRRLLAFWSKSIGKRRRPLTFHQLAASRVAPAALGKVERQLRHLGFDPIAYRDASPDLVAAGLDENGSLAHFIAYAGTEYRQFPLQFETTLLPALIQLPLPIHVCGSFLSSLLQACMHPLGWFWRAPHEQRVALWRGLIEACKPRFDLAVLVGDSHSNLYVGEIKSSERPMVVVQILCSGCSALGLANPLSRSGAGERLKLLAASLPAHLPIFFKFGQVDVEFVFNFNRIRDGRIAFSVTEFAVFCQRSIDAYIDFLARSFDGLDVHVISIFPPTLSDRSWASGYVNAHVVSMECSQNVEEIVRGVCALEIPPLSERTRHHALFNDILRNAAVAKNMVFLSDFNLVLGKGDVVNARFTGESMGSDHHLDHRPTYPILSAFIEAQYKVRQHRWLDRSSAESGG